MPQSKDRLTNWIKSQDSSVSVLFSGDPSHMQRYPGAQNKGMEEDLASKWGEK